MSNLYSKIEFVQGTETITQTNKIISEDNLMQKNMIDFLFYNTQIFYENV